MVKKRAIIIALLLLLVPSVFAIQVTHLGGTDHIKGFISSRVNEKLIGEIIIESADPVLPEQVRLEYSNTYENFKKCEEQQPGIQKCTYEETPAYPGEYRVSVYSKADIYKPKPVPIFSEKIEVKEDRYGPKILLFNIKPSITNQKTINLEYNLEDYSDIEGDPTYCTGIKELSVVAGSSTTTFQGNGICKQADSQSFTLQTTKEREEIELCLTAKDKLNKVGLPVCKKVVFDQKSPELTTLTFKDQKRNVITHVSSNQPFDVQAQVQILDDDLDKTSISADFSKLNPSETQRKYDDDFSEVFSWDVHITQTDTCEVLVKASDSLGNKAEKTFKCSFPLDNSPPTIKSLEGERKNKNGEIIIGKEATIKAVFEDMESGVNTAYLEASSLGVSKLKSDKCEKNKCDFTLKSQANEGPYNIAIHPDTTDGAGNRISNNMILKVILDTSPPIIKDIKPEIISGQEKYNYLVQGSTLLITITGEDLSEITGNFSKIGVKDLVKGTCKEENRTQTCTIRATVEDSGPYKFKIPITVLDAAGNKAIHEQEGEVFELLEGTSNYWDYKTSCSPEKLDRQLTQFKSLTFFCGVTLKQNNLAQTIEVMDAKLNFLTDCKLDKEGMIDDIKVSNSVSNNPYLEVKLKKVSGGKELNTTCNLKVYTKVNNKIARNPQVITVPIIMQFYNQPYDNVYDSYNKEVDRAIKDAEKRDDLSSLKKLLDNFEKICSIKNNIADIMTTLYVITEVVGKVEDYVSWLPGWGQAAYAARYGLCEANEEIKESYIGKGGMLDNYLYEPLNKFCMISNCQLGVGMNEQGGWGKALKQYGGGGQAPWCQDWDKKLLTNHPEVKNALDEINQEKKRSGTQPIQSWNVKDSLVTSVGCLCLPGIIENWEKLRQIKCQYAKCLIDDLPNLGVNKADCSSEKSFAECAFVVGEVWNLIPFTNFIDSVTTRIGEIISDPIKIVSAFAGLKCRDYCSQKPSTGYTVCAGLRTIALAGEAYQSWTQIGDMNKDENQGKGIDYCQALDNAKKV